MKNTLYIISILVFSMSKLLGQETAFPVDSVAYITKLDKARLIDKKTKIALKTSPLAVEWKILKDVSLSTSFDLRYRIPISLESRYYYKMRDRINQGLQSNNISGPYVSLFGWGGKGFKFVDNQLDEEGYTIGFRIGQQQRILNSEYFDISFETAFRHRNLVDFSDTKAQNFSLRLRAIYGFVLAKKHDIDSESTCAFVMCHTNRKSAIKINLSDFILLSNTYGDAGISGGWFFYTRPNISYERKIANSAFSIEQEINSFIRFGQSDIFENLNDDFNLLFQNRITFKLGGRYYFKMKKKMMEGKSGNNLSGIYLHSRVNHTIQKDRNDGFLEAGIGFQKELFGNIFVEYGAYLRFRTYGEKYESRFLETPLAFDFKLSYVLN